MGRKTLTQSISQPAVAFSANAMFTARSKGSLMMFAESV